MNELIQSLEEITYNLLQIKGRKCEFSCVKKYNQENRSNIKRENDLHFCYKIFDHNGHPETELTLNQRVEPATS